MGNMRSFYIGHFDGERQIQSYCRDFFGLVLNDLGFIPMELRQDAHVILSTVGSRDRVHLELAGGDVEGWELLLLMVKANYRNVSVTVHSPQWFPYGVRETTGGVKTIVNRLVAMLFGRYRGELGWLSRLKHIYVFSPAAAEVIRRRLPANAVSYLPVVVNPFRLHATVPGGGDIVCHVPSLSAGKLPHLLKVHSRLLERHPATNLYVVISAPTLAEVISGFSAGFRRNVHFLGSGEEEDRRKLFADCRFGIVLEDDPLNSGSCEEQLIGYFLTGKICFVRRSSRLKPLFTPGKQAFELTADVRADAAQFGRLLEDASASSAVTSEINAYLTKNHLPESILKSIRKDFDVLGPHSTLQ